MQVSKCVSEVCGKYQDSIRSEMTEGKACVLGVGISIDRMTQRKAFAGVTFKLKPEG